MKRKYATSKKSDYAQAVTGLTYMTPEKLAAITPETLKDRHPRIAVATLARAIADVRQRMLGL